MIAVQRFIERMMSWVDRVIEKFRSKPSKPKTETIYIHPRPHRIAKRINASPLERRRKRHAKSRREMAELSRRINYGNA